MEKENSVRPFTEYLPLGYIYLILLGIVSDSIYYGILGVNIMSYSNVLDVLLSPIVNITSNLVLAVTFVGLPLFCYLYLLLIRKLTAKKDNTETNKKNFFTSLSFTQLWVVLTAFSVFSAFMGLGLGGGFATKKSLERKDFNLTHKLSFNDGETIQAKVIGNNGSYVFYVLKNQSQVVVSPIQNNIKKIEKISTK